jgi:hypothetical protein
MSPKLVLDWKPCDYDKVSLPVDQFNLNAGLAINNRHSQGLNPGGNLGRASLKAARHTIAEPGLKTRQPKAISSEYPEHYSEGV